MRGRCLSPRSRRRHTAQEQPFEVLIQYSLQPRAGERVAVVRRLQHGGSSHFVIEQPDGMRALLPAWMTEPWAAQIAVVKMPRLTLEALFTLRKTIDGALLSLSPATPMKDECDDRPTSEPPTARSARAYGQCARTEPNPSADSGGSDRSAKTADIGAPGARRLCVRARAPIDGGSATEQPRESTATIRPGRAGALAGLGECHCHR